MKLKLVVASMSVLGLISSPLFAATHHKNKHHYKETKHHVRHVKHEKVTHVKTRHVTHVKHVSKHVLVRQAVTPVAPPAPVPVDTMNSPALTTETQEEQAEAAPVNYKNEVPQTCSISKAALILESATQNEGRSMPDPCSPGWYNRVHVSGGVNVDMGKFGNRNVNFQGENYKRVSINDAYINVSGTLSEWANAFVSLSYSNPTASGSGTDTDGGDSFTDFGNQWNFGYSNVYKLNELSLEQGYLTLGNFAYSPIYLQAGKQFQDYGRYTIHPITVPMTQVMTETLAQSLKLGTILPTGFHADISLFDDPIKKAYDGSTKPLNYVFALGYDQANQGWGWDAGGAYIFNNIASQDVKHAVRMFTMEDYYYARVGGIAFYGDVYTGPFSFSARWASTIQRFNPRDLPQHGWADFDSSTDDVFSYASGAKPWALDLQAGYTFDPWCRTQTLYAGYQASREAAGLGLPKERWIVGWNVGLFRDTALGIEWNHDNDYSRGDGGRNKNTNLVSLRASVQFD